MKTSLRNKYCMTSNYVYSYCGYIKIYLSLFMMQLHAYILCHSYIYKELLKIKNNNNYHGNNPNMPL